MSKDDAVRIVDTIAFIRGADVPLAHQLKRATVADILDNRNTAGRIMDVISPVMSQGRNLTIIGREQAKENRNYRRAIILIRTTLLGVDRTLVAGPVTAIPDASLPTALGDALNDVTARLLDLNTKLTLLKTHPLTFLGTYNLQINGSQLSSQCTYGFYFDQLNGVYNFAPPASIVTWVSLDVPVYHVHVQPYASLPRTSKGLGGGDWITATGAAVLGADLMITTQLTGCSVMYHLNGANLVAAHVQPTGGTNAETMCTTLRADGRLTGAPNVTGVFGAQTVKGVDPNNYVKAGFYNYCIGVRSGGTWDLYGQQRPRSYGAHVGAALVAWQIT